MTTDYRRLAVVIALTKRKLAPNGAGRPDDVRHPSATSTCKRQSSCPERSK
jgi:hypothetical protein